MAIDMNALRAKAMEKKTEKPPEFIPIDLNEGNVQAIFNRCIAKEGTPEDKCFNSILFSRLRGYSSDAERIVVFNREKVLANKKNIRYFYGQLKNIHAGNKNLQISEAFLTYSGTHWTTNKGVLLEFLYLGAINDGHCLLCAFDAESNNSTILNTDTITPTLSPKDPAFPTWWEAHKAEWED
ncbi:hypothetical protein [Subdoligranulum variabile]|uniref:hypothetical protein n=1 Tax=Subdoligranulum variabile TaxID=214851 RepID=UPI0002E137B2|nr:hypothetical protein [Subdoligranulum variabile]UWP68321.1 hypothetical protein NQ490_00210 [Subdoligranulum variabile]